MQIFTNHAEHHVYLWLFFLNEKAKQRSKGCYHKQRSKGGFNHILYPLIQCRITWLLMLSLFSAETCLSDLEIIIQLAELQTATTAYLSAAVKFALNQTLVLHKGESAFLDFLLFNQVLKTRRRNQNIMLF